MITGHSDSYFIYINNRQYHCKTVKSYSFAMILLLLNVININDNKKKKKKTEKVRRK